MNNPLILITNDDGIEAPGLHAAAAALSQYDLICVAPRLQQSGMSSALSNDSQRGAITAVPFVVGSKKIPAYAVQGTPTLAVAHAILEICDRRPALCVSGINAGANVGRSIRYSGTIGAAFEAHNYGIPALAVSLALSDSRHAPPTDWSAAQYFTRIFAEELLSKRGHPARLALLNINVPATATASTPYEFTRQSSQRFYEFVNPGARAWSKPQRLQYRIAVQPKPLEKDGDIACLTQRKHVSVTPLSADWTCRLDGEYTPFDRFISHRLRTLEQQRNQLITEQFRLKTDPEDSKSPPAQNGKRRKELTRLDRQLAAVCEQLLDERARK